jgi:hypothetical protein
MSPCGRVSRTITPAGSPVCDRPRGAGIPRNRVPERSPAGYPVAGRWTGSAARRRGVVVVAPERRRSASDYEQALRRQELAAGRALVQVLPADGPPGPKELAAARRVLTQALFDLRRLARDLDQELEQLRARQRAGRRPGEAPGSRERARGAAGPGELERYEGARDAIDEVIERWEGRREQLASELERRQPRRPGDRKDAGRVSGRRGGAPARPGPPRSRRSRRSPG